MVKTQTISTRYTVYKDPKFVTLCENILTGAQANEKYQKPPTPYSEMISQLAELAAAVKAMATGLHAATAQRDYLRPLVEANFKALSEYVVRETPGRIDLWTAANFPITKGETSPRQASQPITGLVLVDGPSAHTLAASADVQPGMYAYAWRIYPRGTTPEQLASGFCYRLCLTRTPKVQLDGLESGVAYCVECAAWNNTGDLQWSAPVSRIVQ